VGLGKHTGETQRCATPGVIGARGEPEGMHRKDRAVEDAFQVSESDAAAGAVWFTAEPKCSVPEILMEGTARASSAKRSHAHRSSRHLGREHFRRFHCGA
jgi:hypothetical protein